MYRRHHRPFSAASIEISFPFFERLVPMFSIWFLKKQQKFIKKNHSQNYFCKSDLPVLFLRSRVDFPSVSLGRPFGFEFLSPTFFDRRFSRFDRPLSFLDPMSNSARDSAKQKSVLGDWVLLVSGVARDHISITSPAPAPAVSPSHISRPPPDFLTD